jgi:hypothetical protein
MTSLTNASKDGFKFEDLLYDELSKNFNNDFTIRREKDIINEYGNDITAIDFEIFNNVKTKDSSKIPSKHVFVQLKWKEKASPISDINHYVHCCQDIEKKKKLNAKDVLHIYGTKVPVSNPSFQALNKLKLSENIYVSEMKNCVNKILNKILTFYNKKTVIFRKPVEDIYDEKTNYDELMKEILIELVIMRYNLKRSDIKRLKHADLVNIIVSKNGGKPKNAEIQVEEETPENIDENKIELDENIMTLEFEEPEIRNNNEKKSKLLKIGSDLQIHLLRMRNLLDKNGYNHDGHSIGLHTEVLNRNGNETLETFLIRVASLEGRRFNIKDINNYDIIGRAIVFLVGELDGYARDAHITISYLPTKDPKEALQIIYNYFNKKDDNNEKIEEEEKEEVKEKPKKEKKVAEPKKEEVIEEKSKKEKKVAEPKKEEVIEEKPKKDKKVAEPKKEEVIEEKPKKEKKTKVV